MLRLAGMMMMFCAVSLAALAGEVGFHPPVPLPGSDNGSEPSLAVAQQKSSGFRFASWQNPGKVATSPDGVNFVSRGLPDPAGGGDVTNAIDPAGTLFLGQFCGGAFELHACLERSLDGGVTWPLKTDFTDMHPGAADRPWIEVFPHKSTTSPWNSETTRVYMEYHTFSPEELAYVTVSTDGGKTFSAPKLITNDTNALVGSLCNTVPGGLAIDETTGTVYALWLSGNDVAHSTATGCNYSQIGPFNKAWVSTSKDGGNTWSAHLAWQGAFDSVTNIGDNASKLFPVITVDQSGQVHVVLPVRHNDDPVKFVADCNQNPTTCAETAQDTDLLLVTSPDSGDHWTLPKPLESSAGSYFFPWAAAGSRGNLDVIHYRSTTRQPNNKTSIWYISMTRVTDAVATYTSGPNATYTTAPQFQEVIIDSSPAHGNGTTGGGICSFGIFCTALGAQNSQNGNRSLADSIAITLDPAGGANAVWSDDAPSPRKIFFACQSSGASAFAGAPDLNGCYGPADLSVTQTDDGPATAGGRVTYHVTVTNNGTAAMPATTSGVRLQDVLPPEVTFVSATPSSGTCSGTGPVVCNFGILPTGSTAAVDIVAQLPSQISAAITNSAAVTSATDDPVPANNSSSKTTTIAVPLPRILSLNPNRVCGGTGPDTITLIGSGFINGSTARLNGSTRPTTFVSSSELRAALSTADLASDATALITVLNPNGVESDAATLPIEIDRVPPVVTAPAPLIVMQTLCPAPGQAGSSGTTSAQIHDFLRAARATDNCTTSVVAELPQSNGAPLNDASVFKAGTATVLFAFRDERGNTGSATSTVSVQRFGDLNLDFEVDAIDAVITANYLVGNLAAGSPPFKTGVTSADLNGDGKIDSIDFVILVNYLVGNFGCLPVR